MNQRQVRAWVTYDWANSAFAATMMAAVMPVFYKSVAGAGLGEGVAASYWGYTQTIAMLCVALLSPILGAIADFRGSKVRFLSVFTFLGALSCLASFFIGEGDWLLASLLVILGTIGFSGGNTFYDALLPDLAPERDRDAVSARGYAAGYLGGGLLLALNIAMIEKFDLFGFPDKTAATQVVFVTVGIWWIIFSIPLLRAVKDRPANRSIPVLSVIRAGFSRNLATLRRIRQYPELAKYMLSYWFFNDGINTIIVMATIYGATIGIEQKDLILALLITQFVGYPATMLFGRLAVRLGSKQSLYLSLVIYVLIVMLGYFMTTGFHFYALAIMVGLVQGGSQAVARSIYANLTPPSRRAEFFGFLSLSSKFSASAGPFLFGLVGTLTGSVRLGILAVLAFFVIGILLLMLVDLAKGRKEALAGENGDAGGAAVN
jgi:Permeases of the major facilitator superfamily